MIRNIYLSKKDKIVYTFALLSLGVLFCMLMLDFDKKAILWANSLHKNTSSVHMLLEGIDPVINFISNGTILLVIAIVFFVTGKYTKANLRELGRILIGGFIVTGITVQTLKYLAGRARPRVSFDTLFYGPSAGDSYHSFPSGHTAEAFCFACILAKYFPRYRIYFYLLASVIGFERMEDLKHFPSDVIAGAVIGVAVSRLLLSKIENSIFPSKSLPDVKS